MPTPAPSLAPTPSSPTPKFVEEETIIPTFETQKLARTYILDIPAPRGQITDRNGVALAQNKLSYNLAITFPTPLDFSDAQALQFARDKIARAEKLIDHPIKLSDEAILRHYHNRGIMPLEIAQDLKESQYNEIKDSLPAGMTLRSIYIRIYPHGKLAGQIVGYTGKVSRNLDGVVDNHQTLWPETEGREGWSKPSTIFSPGKHGEYKLTFDKDGRKTSDRLVTQPVPGNNVVTTLDVRLQELAEKPSKATPNAAPLSSSIQIAAISWLWPPGRRLTRTLLFLRYRPRSSKLSKTILIFRFCPGLSVPPTRRDRLSRSRWESPRWKVARSVRRIYTNASRPSRSEI